MPLHKLKGCFRLAVSVLRGATDYILVYSTDKVLGFSRTHDGEGLRVLNGDKAPFGSDRQEHKGVVLTERAGSDDRAIGGEQLEARVARIGDSPDHSTDKFNRRLALN